jgi:hypothetical protein
MKNYLEGDLKMYKVQLKESYFPAQNDAVIIDNKWCKRLMCFKNDEG